MEYRELGQTGLWISRLCFGALTMGPLQRGLSPQKGGEILREALNLGVNFIDTAELYQTYDHIRHALQDFEGEHPVVITTKSYAYTREGMLQSLEKALEEMDLSCIPIFMLHEQESSHTLRGHWPALEVLWEAKKEGLVQAVGISTHHVEGVLAASDIPEIDVISPLINKTGIGIQGGTREDMLQAIAKAAECQKGIVAMKPLGGGHLLAKWSSAFDYLLGQSAIDSIAVGMKTVDEVRHNVAFFAGRRDLPEPKPETRRLHIDSWCVGCGACVNACPNGALEVEGGKARVVAREECVFCGYCGASCPEFAIKVI
ncbi:MAG TPA: aldo/keto reductase [Limnochordia bacterium]|nr:aldo/keto reductase [Limnochordia bacterium]